MKDPAARRKRRRRWLTLTAAFALLVWLFTGRTSAITPPPMPTDPVRVFVLQEAMHTGLVLPPRDAADPDGYVEFGFGDWSWYALGNESWYHAFATVLWPTQGGLGRRTFGARLETELHRRVTWARLLPITVSAAKAHALRTRLQAEFDARLAEAVTRRDLGFHFVPSASSYWLPNNCADAVTDWLRALDCHVTEALFRTALRVPPREDEPKLGK